MITLTDDLLEKIDDAIEDQISGHYTLPDYECRCGAINNMDGDVLHSHRLGVISDAVRKVLETADVSTGTEGRYV